MAKSKILKDLANKTVSIEIALNRLLIILNDLNAEELIIWVEKELSGYLANEAVPEYRKLGVGNLVYSGVYGTIGTHVKYDKLSFPLSTLNKEWQDSLNETMSRETIANVEDKAKSIDKTLVFGRDLTFLSQIIDSPVQFTSIEQQFSVVHYMEIINKLSTMLLKIFMKLDKEFGNLDDLDIDGTDINKVEKTKQDIYQIVFIDNSIKIGDNNKIEKSDIKVGL